jgi:hypothetical protein
VQEPGIAARRHTHFVTWHLLMIWYDLNPQMAGSELLLTNHCRASILIHQLKELYPAADFIISQIFDVIMRNNAESTSAYSDLFKIILLDWFIDAAVDVLSSKKIIVVFRSTNQKGQQRKFSALQISEGRRTTWKCQ